MHMHPHTNQQPPSRKTLNAPSRTLSCASEILWKLVNTDKSTFNPGHGHTCHLRMQEADTGG